jgi:hypothetical protein
VDSFTFTGYGREKARTLASKEPLAIATQRAMRDGGAKVAVELTDQDSVRLLLRGAGSPLPVSPPAPPEVLKAPSRQPTAPGASGPADPEVQGESEPADAAPQPEEAAQKPAEPRTDPPRGGAAAISDRRAGVLGPAA